MDPSTAEHGESLIRVANAYKRTADILQWQQLHTGEPQARLALQGGFSAGWHSSWTSFEAWCGTLAAEVSMSNFGEGRFHLFLTWTNQNSTDL